MKTIVRTIPIFIVLMVLTYFIPQIISDTPSEIVTQKKNMSELKKEPKTDSIPAVKQETFSLEGIGQYMGKTSDVFKNSYGEPLRIESTLLGYEWWIYGNSEQDYVQVGVSEENTIVSIFVLGSSLDVSPFEIGMDITEIYQLATLYPTFSIDYKNRNYTIELSENDLNYHPLVIFENNIFSILMVDRKTNKINAIRYVDKQTLLESDIYEVSHQNKIHSSKKRTAEVEAESKGNAQEVEITLNALRKRYDLNDLAYSEELSTMAKDIFSSQTKFISEQSSDETKIKDESLTESLMESDRSNGNEGGEEVEPSPLTSEIIQDYLKMNKMSLADTRVVYSNQFSDPTWLITYWFSLENQRMILSDPLMKRFGFAFRGEEVMLILDKEEANTIK